MGSLALTRTCRRIRYEALPLLYPLLTFDLQRGNIEDLLDLVGVDNTSLVTSLEMHANEVDAMLADKSLGSFQKYRNQLTTLERLYVKGLRQNGRQWIRYILEADLRLCLGRNELKVTISSDEND
jgi:hypothetical protein